MRDGEGGQERGRKGEEKRWGRKGKGREGRRKGLGFEILTTGGKFTFN